MEDATVPRGEEDLPADWPEDCDVLVAGAGAAGMTAALAAAAMGARVLLVEATDRIGGSTSYSGGVLWIPGNARDPATDDLDERRQARAYIAAETGNRYDAARTERFLCAGAEAVRFMETQTALRFQRPAFWPDYHAALPGSAEGGRSMRAATFDGRRLGRRLALLRPALPETTLFGGMMVGGDDLPRLAGALRSWGNAAHAARLLGRYLRDLALAGRATRLTNGAALAAALACSLFERGMVPRLSVTLAALDRAPGTAYVATLRSAVLGERKLRVRRGVVLAGGGLAADPAHRAAHYRGAAAGSAHRSLAPAGNRGDTIGVALRLGAGLEGGLGHAAAWVPLSRVPRRDGGAGHFPHFFDRSKPGFAMVDRGGRRFANEALSYHDLGAAMLERAGDGPAEAFILCDHWALRRYGLGVVRPAPFPLRGHLRSGYLVKGADLAELAARTGIDAAGLAATLAAYNEAARAGHDPQFRKGETAYERYIGDATHRPNPCVAPIETPPFYAVQVGVGDIGSFVGLRTDGEGRVLAATGMPIPGLFAAGNDAASLFAGSYPAAGITLGPALVFGYLAGREAALSPAAGASPAG